jgi:outer membrane protein assembly factor BamD
MAHMAILVVLVLVFADWTHLLTGNDFQFAGSTKAAEKAADGIADQNADKQMVVARYYLDKRNHLGAINRFKIVVTQFQTSRHIEEALAHIAEIYVALGIASEAQTAIAVLDRKFPNGHWSAEAHEALKSAGLEPVEDEKSWISRAFK